VDKTSIRINKFLARAGVASRRGADDLIREGKVKLNGTVVKELGVLVDPDKDKISVNGKLVGAFEDRVTIVLNKPVDVMTTMSDPQGRETVAQLVKSEPFRLVPVGRLDFPTEGVLLMTTDGELANRVLHPRYKVPKSYYVKLGGRPTEEALDRLRNGISLEDGRTKPALVDVLESEPRRTWIEIILTEGKKRQVRRMCEAIGHRPLRVIRTSFSTIDLGDLRPGQYRYLGQEELMGLYKLIGMSRSVPPAGDHVLQMGSRKLGLARRRKGVLPGEVRAPKRDAATRIKAKAKPRSDATKQGTSKSGPVQGKWSKMPKRKSPIVVRKPADSTARKGVKPSDYRKRADKSST
jgi:23S rRNA pseudouridine2605 synthase